MRNQSSARGAFERVKKRTHGSNKAERVPAIAATTHYTLQNTKSTTVRTCPQESLGDLATVMLDTDLNGTNGFSIIGPSEDAYAGSAVAGAGVRKAKTD